MLELGSLAIDLAAREVRVRDALIEVSAREFELLTALAADPTRVFTKDELLQQIWGFQDASSSRTLDSHACRLRRKLGAGGERFVVNVWGVGYCLVQPERVRNAVV